MSPFGIATSRSIEVNKTHVARLWVVLIGVNKYRDKSLSSLRYSAIDCQGLGEALRDAGGYFSQTHFKIHHDFAAKPPTLANIRSSLEEVVNAAKSKDTVLFYFSGHGILGPNHEAFLCLHDTDTQNLESTGLSISTVLSLLANCAAQNKLIMLDACHSGGMSLRHQNSANSENITPQLVSVLQQSAASGQGFYALLSCDNNQQSWEFNELGHGVFTYYLMQGLRGGAANSQGLIYVDNLYKYVYYQTLQYIDKYNQQIRLINQQNQSRGFTDLLAEYTLQTPKRIVEGIGELIIGKKPENEGGSDYRRLGVVVDGLLQTKTCLDISKILRNQGDFELEYLPAAKSDVNAIKTSLVNCLNAKATETVLIYLRGIIAETDEWEGFIFGENIRIKRSWLKQQLQRCPAKQIVIIDCISHSESSVTLAAWMQELHINSPQGQCLIACVNPHSESEIFSQVLLETLNSHHQNHGLSAAGWISQLKLCLAGSDIPLYLWLSGAQGIIEILPVQTHLYKQKTSKDLGVCPYMGLNAFTEQDSLYFHGREALIQEIVHHISNQPFLALVGASGSGKSSVIQAGVIPVLRQGKQIPDSQNWVIRKMRPGVNPLMSLAQVLGENNQSQMKLSAEQIEGIVYQGSENFVYWLRLCPEPMLVLVIDQFEEIFTLASGKERKEFLKLIFAALEFAPDRFKVVITLRADFIAACLEQEKLAIALRNYTILVPPHLSLDNYRRVIVNPAQQVGLQIEPELVEVLLRELNHSVADLPLLEFVLEQLWQYRVNGRLTLDAYQEKLGGIQGALERSSQAVYDSLNPQMQACAKWIFLALTQLGEGTEDTRRRVYKSELIVAKYPADLVEKTLKVLTDAKLVVMGVEDKEKVTGMGKGVSENHHHNLFNSHQVTVEVAHEILIRHWSTLRWWLEENRSRLRVQRQIEESAQLWLENNCCPDFLLQGVRLAEAEDIYINYTDELATDTQKFIAACLEARQLQQLQVKRRLRMTQIAVVVMGSLGLIACGLAGFAYQQSQKTKLEEIKTLNSLAENYLLSHKQLDGLVTAMKAAKKIRSQVNWWGWDKVNRMEAQLRTEKNLNQAVVDIMESNRLSGHNSLVMSAKFSQDGQTIATTSADKTIKIWQANGKLLKTLVGHQDTVNDVDFSPDGQLIASGSEDNTIKLWRPDGTLITSINAHSAPILAVKFTQNGEELISASRDLSLKFWNQQGQHLRTLSAENLGITDIPQAFHLTADGTTLILAMPKGEIIFVNMQGEKIQTFQLPQQDMDENAKISAIAFSPNRQTLAVANTQGKVLILDRDGKVLYRFQDHSAKVTRLTYSPNSQILVSSSTDNTIKIWGLDGTLLQTLAGHGRTINYVAFSPDGQTFVSASDDKTVRLWQLNNIIPLSLRGHERDVVDIAFSPDGKYFISASADGTLILWHKSGKILRKFTGHQQEINKVVFSPDQQTIASVSVDNTIKLWRPNGNLIKTIPLETDWYSNLTFSPDGKTLVYSNTDNTIKLWHQTTNKIHTLSGHSYWVTSLSYSPDGQIMASASADQTIKLWNPQGNLIKTIPAHDALIWHVIFSPAGNLLASASHDGKIKLWSRNGELIRTINAHNHEVNKISFSPNGEYIASASDDQTIKVWTTHTGQLVKTLTGHNSNVRSVTFSPDGKYIVSGDADNLIKIWNFTSLASSKLDFDSLFKRGCNWLHNYLENHPHLSTEERHICQGENR